MSRRIDIELTSRRDDETWTWRAAGAREPKGVVEAELVPEGASVGDELRVEAEFLIDGIEIVAVLPAKTARSEPERLELLGSGRDSEGGVTTSLAPRRGGRDRRDRGERRERDEQGRRGRGDRDDRGRGGRGGRGDKDRARGGREGRRPPRREAPERPPPPAKPKPKRLRAGRTHRNEILASLPEERRPIAEQVLRGGVPAVRKAVEEQNARNRADGRPEIDPGPLVQLAEELLPPLKEAEWHDRADAAMKGMAELDLRDLRSVVVAAESAARSEPTRALAGQLREAVAARVDQDQAAWLAEIGEALDDERTVRALRMSSRPPKAGAPLPPELAARLAEAANAALSDQTGPQRWGTVLDAVAYSPVRQSVTPSGIPARPSDELLETVKRLSSRVPEIAALFGVEPQAASRRPRRGERRKGRPSPGRAAPPKPPPRAAEPAPDAAAEPEAPAAAPVEVEEAPAPEAAAPAAAPVEVEEAPAPDAAAEPEAPAAAAVEVEEAPAAEAAAEPEAPAAAPVEVEEAPAAEAAAPAAAAVEAEATAPEAAAEPEAPAAAPVEVVEAPAPDAAAEPEAPAAAPVEVVEAPAPDAAAEPEAPAAAAVEVEEAPAPDAAAEPEAPAAAAVEVEEAPAAEAAAEPEAPAAAPAETAAPGAEAPAPDAAAEAAESSDASAPVEAGAEEPGDAAVGVDDEATPSG